MLQVGGAVWFLKRSVREELWSRSVADSQEDIRSLHWTSDHLSLEEGSRAGPCWSVLSFRACRVETPPSQCPPSGRRGKFFRSSSLLLLLLWPEELGRGNESLLGSSRHLQSRRTAVSAHNADGATRAVKQRHFSPGTTSFRPVFLPFFLDIPSRRGGTEPLFVPPRFSFSTRTSLRGVEDKTWRPRPNFAKTRRL